ncbi:dienelactone hydrolase family protein [Sphingobium phenoxybenzoativorans]|uniref:Dienelactone hydrolase family protein n=1 Tax=Sphingobium phenoxybenzoativorans TaxID=1592790 RepID=A0A975K4C4_9SPHN|nr:dienelactone hydrolase family protein [Sphingobium phenoxybenzoativorans]QUT04605.1 dienelactone hydrolase family protein [Sphingobium phenoxybenzoativorans]
MTIITQDIAYTGDGLAMKATLYIDDARTTTAPGVLLYPEAFGPGPHVHAKARRLADEGFAAIVCDLHGNAQTFSDIAEVMPLLDILRPDPARIRSRAAGALDAVMKTEWVDPLRIAAIGFCFGGTMALELGRSGAPIKAIVGFHSGLATNAPQDASNISCPVLVCIGADDPGIPAEQRLTFEKEMREGQVDWTMHLYGGVVHSFTNPDADKIGRPEFARYDAAADAHSWKAMMELFNRVLI